MNLQPTIKYEDWAAAMYVIGPRSQVPVVRDNRFLETSKWKFPGGRKESGETPAQTACRELREETGLWVEPSEVVFLSEIDKGNHMLYLFGGKVDSFRWIKACGDEGEEIKLVEAGRILKMKRFFGSYKQLLKMSPILSLSEVA